MQSAIYGVSHGNNEVHNQYAAGGNEMKLESFSSSSHQPMGKVASFAEKKQEKLKKDNKFTVEIAQSAQWIIHEQFPVIRKPYSLDSSPCGKRQQDGHSVHNFAGPNKSRKRHLRVPHNVPIQYMYGGEPRWPINSVAAVPMKSRKWKRMTSLGKPVPMEEWKIKEGAIKSKREQDMALKLGYETLLGNLVHIPIPGAGDLNRSWNHFLRQDEMAWGFPYWRGSTERPQPRPPPPYLVHQLKEKIWKYPRARILKTQQTKE